MRSALATTSPVFTPVLLRQPDAPRRIELFVERDKRGLHPAAARTARSASSSCAHRQPEHGHDRVADVLLDRPAVPLDLARHGREVSGLDLVHGLRVELLAEAGGALEIDEDQGHDLAELGLARRARRAACRSTRTGGTDPGSLRGNSDTRSWPLRSASCRLGHGVSTPACTEPDRPAVVVRARTPVLSSASTVPVAACHAVGRIAEPATRNEPSAETCASTR